MPVLPAYAGPTYLLHSLLYDDPCLVQGGVIEALHMPVLPAYAGPTYLLHSLLYDDPCLIQGGVIGATLICPMASLERIARESPNMRYVR